MHVCQSRWFCAVLTWGPRWVYAHVIQWPLLWTQADIAYDMNYSYVPWVFSFGSPPSTIISLSTVKVMHKLNSPLSAVHKSMQSAQIGYAITRETFSRSSISPFYYQWYCKWFFHSRQCLPSDIFGVQPGLEGNCEHQWCKMQLLTSKSHSTSHQKVKAASPASSSMWR